MLIVYDVTVFMLSLWWIGEKLSADWCGSVIWSMENLQLLATSLLA